VVHGGDEDDRNVAGGRVGAQQPEYLVAAHAGHDHVEQDQVRLRFVGGDTQGIDTRNCAAHTVGRAQQFEQDAKVFRHVVDDEDGREPISHGAQPVW
jgi:hypothetical protein